MGRLVLPSRLTQQPNFPAAVDFSHPLFTGINLNLVEVFLPAAARFVDVAQGVEVPRYTSASGATPVTIAGPVGLCTQVPYNGSNAANGFVKSSPLLSPAGGYTRLVWILAYNIPTGGNGQPGVLETTGVTDTFRSGISMHADTLAFRVEVRSGSFETATASVVTGTLPRRSGVMVCTFLAGASSLLEVYCDGSLCGRHSGAGTANSFPSAPLKMLWVGNFSGAQSVALAAQIPNADISGELASELSINPWQIFQAQPRAIYVDVAAGGTPNIQPSGIASAEAFGTATLTRASVQAVTATGIASAEAFGGAAVARTSVQAVTATGIASAEAFGTAAVTRSSVQAAAPSGIASAEAFGTATVTRSSVQAVAPTGIASAEAFGTHTITPGGVVVPQGIPSAEAFGTATLTRTSVQSVSATGIASGEAFGSATVTRTSAQSIVVSGIASGEAFGSATFTRIGQGVVAPQGIASAEAFGTATLTRTSVKTVVATGIASSEAFGAPVVSIPGERTLTAQDLADIADAVWAHPKALTIARFLGLK